MVVLPRVNFANGPVQAIFIAETLTKLLTFNLTGLMAAPKSEQALTSVNILL